MRGERGPTSFGPLLVPNVRVRRGEFDQGQGAYLVDAEGRRFLDGSSGAVVCNIGHAVEEVARAMHYQARRLEYVSRLQGENPPSLKLADVIVTRWAPREIAHVWFTSSGSDAIEGAIRLARQYHVENGDTTRYKVISTWQSYHGSTLGALAASGREGPRALYQPYFSGAWPHIEGAYCYRCPYGTSPDRCGARCAQELERLVAREGPETVSAFIVEPVVGTTTGGTHPPGEYFDLVREICSTYGILLIVDEIMSGFGRTGAKFAIDHWQCIPDIIASGKGLGCGYVPLFAVLLRDRIASSIASGSGVIGLGNTYDANPLACAIGGATLEFIERHGLVERARAAGERLRVRLDELSDLEIVGDVRGLGLMQGIEFVSDRNQRFTFRAEERVAEKVAYAARERGLLVTHRGATSDGSRGDHVFITPPLTVSDREIDDIATILGEAIAEVAQHQGRR